MHPKSILFNVLKMPLQLLTFNCHEAWIHQLSYLDAQVEIVDGLINRYQSRWDTHVRPVPENGCLISFDQLQATNRSYDCLIAHNLTDLMDLKYIPGPRILVLHTTLNGRLQSSQSSLNPQVVRALMQNYLQMVGGHAVAISALKGHSWGWEEDIVSCGADPDVYLPWSGHLPVGLRVAHQITAKKEILLWSLHQEAFEAIPVQLVGFNPDIPGVKPSNSWADLKLLLSAHRFFIHTAHPQFEDGYNMAMLEAMAAGLPVLGNVHPTSPIEHGVSGFLSDDPHQLAGFAKSLLEDHALARRMGEAARQLILERFSIHRFAKHFKQSILTAQQKYLCSGKV
ncbi:MAG: glycosyltransferase [Magnetococcus sp. DMHC-6]